MFHKYALFCSEIQAMGGVSIAAKAMGLSEKTLQSYINQSRKPRTITLICIANLMKKPSNYFL